MGGGLLSALGADYGRRMKQFAMAEVFLSFVLPERRLEHSASQ